MIIFAKNEGSMIHITHTTAISGQKPGTNGLRKKTTVFMQPNYLENYTQAIFDVAGAKGKTFVLGGDGRFFNAAAVQVILRMAAANGVAQIIVGQGGLLSTPAASHLIRNHQADGGLILSASHNPGGSDGDFGLKLNLSNGGPAPESVTEAIYARTQTITQYSITQTPDIDLDKIGTQQIGQMRIDVIDPVADYAALMEQLFDFPAIRALFASGFAMRMDSMNAITGPYAREILERRLGAKAGTVVNAVPLPDFGGLHPDPNPTWAHTLVDEMMSVDAPDFGAASDGDGDRNMILGRGAYVSPGDSLAILAANAHLAPAYSRGIAGAARSMPTSAAIDLVMKKRGLPCYETPTGWKFFGNLLDAGRVTLCGEESFGTGSDHVREKDGLWAILLWLNILAVKQQSVAQIMQGHWAEYGRHYYSRHDFENLNTASADALMTALMARLSGLIGQTIAGQQITLAEVFAYDDPIDGAHSANQGIRIATQNGGRAVFRLSGTGTEGATLRIYFEQYCPADGDLDQETQAALAQIIALAHEVTGLEHHIGRVSPDVII